MKAQGGAARKVKEGAPVSELEGYRMQPLCAAELVLLASA